VPADDARQQLAEQQSRLVAALTTDSPPPDGFDADRVELTSHALVNKRRRGIAKAWPRLSAALGDDFPRQFDDFAASGVSRAPGAPAADGLAFACWLADRNSFPSDPAADAEVVAHRLWARRGIVIALRRGSRGLLIGVRAPLVGDRLFPLPFLARSR
jgi:hypothetical protein